jgi:hypothetical protein
VSAAKKKTARKHETPKKRGRRPKDILWQQAPRIGIDLTLETANEFTNSVVKRELPPKTFETYNYWIARYEKAKFENGRTEHAAKSHANRETSKHFNCDIQTVRNRIGALRATLKKETAWQQANVFPLMHQYNEDVKRLKEALLLDKAFADLEVVTVDLRRFRQPDASQPGSPQRLASVLAAALIRAHFERIAAEERAAKAEKELGHARTKLAAARNAGYG